MKIILFFLFCNLAWSQLEEVAFDYHSLKEQAQLFDRKKLTLSGVVSDVKTLELKDGLKYINFKLSKTSKVEQYLNVLYFIQFKDKEFPHPEIQNNQILEVEGEFRRTFDNFDAKNLGDLYINKSAFEKLRAAYSIEKRKQDYINPQDDKKAQASVYEMAIDYIGNKTPPVVDVSGYVSKINYKEEQNGDIYWELLIKDHKKEDAKGWSDTAVLVKYYLYLRGNQFADINMEDFFFEDQKVNFKGRYLFKEKQELNPIAGILEMNYLDEKEEYQDFFVKAFKTAERKNVAIISNANNDSEVNQKIKEGEFDEKIVGPEEQ